jgi:hypothetical protein
MNKVILLETQKHKKGDIEKGSVYYWNKHTELYELTQNGIVVSTVNEEAVKYFNKIFKKI